MKMHSQPAPQNLLYAIFSTPWQVNCKADSDSQITMGGISFIGKIGTKNKQIPFVDH